MNAIETSLLEEPPEVTELRLEHRQLLCHEEELVGLALCSSIAAAELERIRGRMRQIEAEIFNR